MISEEVIMGDLFLLYFINEIKDINSRLSNLEVRVDGILKRMKVEDKAIEELSTRIDGEADVIVNLLNDHEKLNGKVEDTHWRVLELTKRGNK